MNRKLVDRFLPVFGRAAPCGRDLWQGQPNEFRRRIVAEEGDHVAAARRKAATTVGNFLPQGPASKASSSASAASPAPKCVPYLFCFICVGEKLEELETFNALKFALALLS